MAKNTLRPRRRGRHLIVSPAQYHQGWSERRDDVEIRHPFVDVTRLEDGNYVVLDPAGRGGRG